MLFSFYMNRIPMQIYLDPDIVSFYKAYAQKHGKSFAEIVRSILAQDMPRLSKTQRDTKAVKPSKDIYSQLVQSIIKLNNQLAKVKDHYPDIDNNTLIYDKLFR